MRKPKSGGWEHHRVTPRARISEPEAFHKPKRLAHRELFKAAAAKSNTMFTGSKTVPSILPSDSVCLRCWARFSTSKSIKNRRSFSSSQPIQEFVLSKVPWRRISPRAYFSANGLLDVTRGQVYNSIQPIPSASQNGVSITKSVKASHVLQNPPSADTPIDRKASDLLDRRKRRNTGGRNGTSDKEPSIPLDASAQLAALSTSLPPSSLRRRLSTLLSLSKPRLTFLMVLTTATAYSLYPVPAVLLPSTSVSPSLSALALVFLTSGTALCSASANALNMLMEPQHDAKMSRTRNRPLVRGLISKRGALVFAGAAGILGVGGLWFGVNPTVAFLGGLNIFLYAGVYTPMKRISVLNTWVGAVVGSIPPLMGWAAAAGQSATGNGAWEELLLGNDNVGGWLLAGLLFAWQFPHFNALSWTIRDEYKNAGYRMLSWTNSKMNGRVALRYSLLFFPICIGLTWYGVTDQGFIITSTVVNAWIVREAWRFWKNEGQKGSARGLFWASVWHLPIVMVLAMAHKKGLWEGIWRRAFGEGDDEDLWEDEAEVEASRPTMPLSPTAI